MATITSAQTGNFSSTSTWVGGVVPTSADDAVAANGHTVTIDTDVTVLSFQQAGTGKFVLGGGRTVTGNVIANAGTFTSGGTVEVTATTGQTATINGNVTGVSTTASNVAGIVVSGTGTLQLNGSVTGSAGNAVATTNFNAGIYTNVQSTINVSGSVTGGAGNFKRGISLGDSSASAVVTLSSGANAGAGAESYALAFRGSSNNGTITGNVVGGSSGAVSVIGGAVTTANLVVNGSLTAVRAIQWNTPSNGLLTINGSITGGSGTAHICLEVTGGAVTVTVTGSVIGGLGTNSRAIDMIPASGTLNITGNISAPSLANAIFSTSSPIINIVGDILPSLNTVIYLSGASSTINLTGNVTGASNSGSSGIASIGASSTVNVIGNITAVSTTSHGVYSAATANGVIFQGNLTDSTQGAVAIWARLVRMTATNNGTTTYTNTVGYPNGTPVTRVSPDLITGMPATNNVRSGTVYGFNSELTGAMAVPESQSVSFGVPVGNTTGTASLRPEDIAALVGAQVAAAVRDLN